MLREPLVAKDSLTLYPLPEALHTWLSELALVVLQLVVKLCPTTSVAGRLTLIVGFGVALPAMSSDHLRLQFDAVSQFPEEERTIVKALLDEMIIKFGTKQMVANLSS